jgi:oxygen-independent coproporphyrinogen-3 oxidase
MVSQQKEQNWMYNGSDWISLYIHIPFCSHKCPYCHFYVIPDKQLFKDSLLDGLKQEWQRLIPQLDSKKLASVYFGGGTPTLFESWRTEQTLDWIATHFGSLDGVEITIEANPEQISYQQMQALKGIGINRVSIGIQSFHQQELDILDRRHSPERARESILAVKEANLHNISIDLMYELPRQTKEQWEETLTVAATLPITHLSLYNLTIEPHTPFDRQRKKLEPLLPDEESATEMYEMAIHTLDKAGLRQYEISAFCKEGFESRHNVGYWTGRFFFGMGPSAFSYFGSKRYRNIPNLSRYVKLLEEGKSTIDFEEELSEEARRKELLALALRLRQGVDLEIFQRRFGPLAQETFASITSLKEQSLLTEINNRICLSHKGVLFYDTVASELI